MSVSICSREWRTNPSRLFGQGTFKLTDTLSLTAGLRWTQDDKELQLIHRREASGAYVVGAPGNAGHVRAGKLVGGHAEAGTGVAGDADDAMLYVSYAKGFKSGGFNGRPLSGIQEVQTPYDPEIVDSYEFGAKTELVRAAHDRQPRGLLQRLQDMQLTINATPQNFVRNAGEAEIKGAEFEVVRRLARGLDFNFSAGYLDAKYTELDPQLATLNPPLTLDKRFVKAPEWTLSSGLQYSFRVGAAGTITTARRLVVQEQGLSRRFQRRPAGAADAFDIVNAYVSFVTSGLALGSARSSART